MKSFFVSAAIFLCLGAACLVNAATKIDLIKFVALACWTSRDSLPYKLPPLTSPTIGLDDIRELIHLEFLTRR